MSVKAELGGTGNSRSWGLAFFAFLGGVSAHYLFANLGADLPEMSVQTAGVLAFVVAMSLVLLGLIYSTELTSIVGRLIASVTPKSAAKHALAPASGHLNAANNNESGREQVSEPVQELLNLIARHLSDSEEYTSILKEADVQLRSKPNFAQIKLIIEHVVSHNAKMRKESKSLSSELNALRSRAEQLNDQLHRVSALANIDDLTGLANRRAAMKQLEAAIDTSHKRGIPLALIIADIDHFKSINDEHGHPVGDAVLKSFSQIIASSVRRSDFVGRFGGEEFVLILPSATAGTALSVISRVQDRLRMHKFLGSAKKRPIDSVTASFGVALIREGESATDLIVRADRKLYEAKNNGRNRAEIDTRLQA